MCNLNLDPPPFCVSSLVVLVPPTVKVEYCSHIYMSSEKWCIWKNISVFIFVFVFVCLWAIHGLQGYVFIRSACLSCPRRSAMYWQCTSFNLRFFFVFQVLPLRVLFLPTYLKLLLHSVPFPLSLYVLYNF